MIPIEEMLTTVSFDRTAKLLQKLVELRSKGDNVLSEKISESVDNFLKAQEIFLSEIDYYLHQESTFAVEDNIETVSTIVQTCPEFLATGDENEWLPIIYAAKEASGSAHKYLKLFADIGIQYSIGGDESRGGMFISRDDAFGCTPLHFIQDPKVFISLQKHDPPLFYKEDIRKCALLHNAVQMESFDLVKYICNLDPSCLNQKDGDNFPIHWALYGEVNRVNLNTIQYLLQQSVLFNISNETIAGLFTRFPHSNGLCLERLVKKWGRNAAWDCIEKAFSINNNIDKMPILHQTIRYAPQYCSDVISRFPSSVHLRDVNHNNRLPIHVALETGMKFSLELEYLIALSHEYLREMDPVTKWPPFVLAAMGESCDLRTIYSLLHKFPEHVERWCDCKYKYVTVESCKRRKMNG